MGRKETRWRDKCLQGKKQVWMERWRIGMKADDGSVSREHRRKAGCLGRKGRVRGEERQRIKEKQDGKRSGKKRMYGWEAWRSRNKNIG